MKQPIFLKLFEYSIPGCDTDASNMIGWNSQPRDSHPRDSHPVETHFPLMKVHIDFEQRKISLEGDGLLITASARKPARTRPAPDKGRIRVKASIYPGCSVDLSDFSNKASVFSLEGIIEDGESTNSCSGLLMLDSTTGRHMSGAREWSLTLYLYDNCNDEREIKLTLTMCSL